MYEYNNSWKARIYSILVLPLVYLVLFAEAVLVSTRAFLSFHQTETMKFREIYRQIWRKDEDHPDTRGV